LGAAPCDSRGEHCAAVGNRTTVFLIIFYELISGSYGFYFFQIKLSRKRHVNVTCDEDLVKWPT
jgi:hypothetical protein